MPDMRMNHKPEQQVNKYILVNDHSPVYHCKNALKLDADCNYAICKECYAKEFTGDFGNGKTSRTHRLFSDKDHKDTKECARIRFSRTTRQNNLYDPSDDECNKDEDDDFKCCHHINDLMVCYDRNNFTEKYKDVIKSRGEKYPFHCVKCCGEFVCTAPMNKRKGKKKEKDGPKRQHLI